MTGAWRYHTVDCVRVWRFYRYVGPAEIVRTALPACVRGGALALPLLAGPAVAPLRPALPLPLPWIGQPDVFGAGPGGIGAYAPGGPGYGFGSPDYAPGVGGPPAVGTAYEVSRTPGLPIAGLAGAAAAGAAGSLPMSAEGAAAPAAGGSPALASDTPRPVPEPASAAVLALAVGVAALVRGKNGGGNRRAILSRRATSNHGVTHA